jgi:hypothetical protein
MTVSHHGLNGIGNKKMSSHQRHDRPFRKGSIEKNHNVRSHPVLLPGKFGLPDMCFLGRVSTEPAAVYQALMNKGDHSWLLWESDRLHVMAAFDAQDQTKEALDWVVLRDGGIALYLRREYLDEDLERFRQQNYHLYSFNCENWTSGGMHADFERTLSFPSDYGRNLDALWDCLQDLPVPQRGGTVIVLNRFDAFQKCHGGAPLPSGRAEGEIVLDILARTSRHFLLTGRRFLTLLQSDDPRLHVEGLAGVAATWNWRERPNKNRGL